MRPTELEAEITSSATSSPVVITPSRQRLMETAQDLLRRMPPRDHEKNYEDILSLAPYLSRLMRTTIDQPLRAATDQKTGKQYLLCDSNRDGGSYRSPWSNEFDPPLEAGYVTSDRLRPLEIEANAAFESYCDLYFGSGISSVYFWEAQGGFAGSVLLKKQETGSKNAKGCWDSIHNLEIAEGPRGSALYRVTSTVTVWMERENEDSGVMNLGGSITRQCEEKCIVTDTAPHLVHIGTIIEEQESKMRMALNELYFGKTKKVLSDLRSTECLSDKQDHDDLAEEIITELEHRGEHDCESVQN